MLADVNNGLVRALGLSPFAPVISKTAVSHSYICLREMDEPKRAETIQNTNRSTVRIEVWGLGWYKLREYGFDTSVSRSKWLLICSYVYPSHPNSPVMKYIFRMF